MVRQPFSGVNGKRASELPLMGKSMQSKVLRGACGGMSRGEEMAKHSSGKLSVSSRIFRQTPQSRGFSHEFNANSRGHLAPQMR
jgi:hypothetical protein